MASLSPTNTHLAPYWPSKSNSTTLREASFSSYLSTSEETCIRTLIESSQNKAVFTKQEHKLRIKKAGEEDSEIDVFSADKYFSSAIDQNPDNGSIKSRSLRRSQQLENSENGSIIEQQIISRTNSSRPKAESCGRSASSRSGYRSNSQSMLLKRLHISSQSNHHHQSRMSHSRAQSSMISLLSCSCCVKKSVEIDTDFNNSNSNSISNSTSNRSRSRSIRNGLHTGYSSKGFTARRSFKINQEARRSVEVFRFNDLEDESNLKRRLNMLSWDAIPRRTAATTTVEINTSGAPSVTGKDTDSSDASSSDLFEIDCLSCSANSNPVIQDQHVVSMTTPVTCNGNGSPTTRYAPSEASIEWSVVTASAAECSDSEDTLKRTVKNTRCPTMTSKSSSNVKLSVKKEERQKPGSSIFLGCKNQKAVIVAKDVHQHQTPGRRKLESQRMHRFSDSCVPSTRFQTEAKLAVLDQRRRQSLSPELLYIH